MHGVMLSFTIATSALRGHIIYWPSLLFDVGAVVVMRDRYGRTAVTGSAAGLADRWAGPDEPPLEEIRRKCVCVCVCVCACVCVCGGGGESITKSKHIWVLKTFTPNFHPSWGFFNACPVGLTDSY